MVQSPSWAADWFAASQEIPRISRNPMVHYRTHKRPLTFLAHSSYLDNSISADFIIVTRKVDFWDTCVLYSLVWEKHTH